MSLLQSISPTMRSILPLRRSVFPVSPYQDQRTWKMTPSMIRARSQYFWPNAITFTVLGGLSVGIYFYTYHFLAKDEFDDIEIPPVSEEDLKKLREEYQVDISKKN
ncbi:Coa3 protein [Saccharomycopsis crataegensis]|uniref:Cytochrome c oxidase assembly factor 3 n=1 Tax=Saccharomycopsis crataegensis TaxID=43959 RepID=A0AAV5QEV9_9ASCO|nr:Coa3 protein [Saccharomycopsis crataegensis]